uniref:Uncharacterized protein n=1 Tax=Photinus pyralis TaxID=7054 RepID=A0A1Y1KMG4_PHOPY
MTKYHSINGDIFTSSGVVGIRLRRYKRPNTPNNLSSSDFDFDMCQGSMAEDNMVHILQSTVEVQVDAFLCLVHSKPWWWSVDDRRDRSSVVDKARRFAS